MIGEYTAISSCISVEEHLITGTIAPYIFCIEDDCCGVTGYRSSIGGGGSRSGRSGRNHAAIKYGEVGCIVLTKEVYAEDIGLACFKGEVVCTTTDAALLRCDPDTITGGGVSNTPVIGACGDSDGFTAEDNDVLGVEVTVCIYRNLILKFIVNACGSIATGGQRSLIGEYAAISSCISIEEHLITGTVAPRIFNFEDDSYITAGYRSCSGGNGSGGVNGSTNHNSTVAGNELNVS